MIGVGGFSLAQPVQRFVSLSTSAATCAARKATFHGRPFRVVPAVLVRSQVLHNNLGSTFLPAEEITDEWAAQWNGVPVLVGAHPSVRGIVATGRTPEVMNDRCVGWIFNARAEDGADGVRRLVGEIWLDEGRAASVRGFPEILALLDANKPVELSTGFSTTSDEQSGVHNGETYGLVMHPAGADHLVISTEMTGACAVADGCGLGANQKETDMAGDAAAAAAAAATAAPAVGTDGKEKGKIKALLTRVGELFGGDKPKFTWADHQALRLQRAVQQIQLSDDEREQVVREELQEEFGQQGEVIIADVYTDTKTVVFWVSGPFCATPEGREYYRTTWTGDPPGDLEFSKPPQLVRRCTTYEPVTPEVGNAGPVEAASNVATQQAHNAEDLMAEKGKELEELTGLVTNLAISVQKLGERLEVVANSGAPAEMQGLKRTLLELSTKFDKMEGVTSAAVNERERERQELVRDLAGNIRVPFTVAELESKSIVELRKLSDMAKPENYGARGGPQGAAMAEQRYAEPEPYFKKQEEKGGK